MKMIQCRRIILPLFILTVLNSALYGRELRLQGKVKHANTYQELTKVNIYIKNTNRGTTTDIQGEFRLSVPEEMKNSILVFEHVSFHPLELNVQDAISQRTFFLRPRVIQLPELSVTAEGERPHILHDLPQPRSVIAANTFELRGYVDAADLLRTEQSVQVDEELSGKKTIAIRGGNPDDVLILYNGIKMNNLYDNIFDLSLINLDDIQQLEVIRGSNTALYGAEAISGIINIIPKTYKNYSIRFQQKIGTYASGDWNLQLNRNFWNKLNVSYSYRQGGIYRGYADTTDAEAALENESVYHTANLVYDLSGGDAAKSEHHIGLMYFNSQLDYRNSYYNETLANTHQLASFRFVGDIGFIKHLNISGSFQLMDNNQVLSTGNSNLLRNFDNRSININVEKGMRMQEMEVLLAYQYENSELDFTDKRQIPNEEPVGIESALLYRQKHGLASILKLHVPTESSFYKATDFDVSFRMDKIRDEYDNIKTRQYFDSLDGEALLQNNEWQESMVKFSSHFAGNTNQFSLNAFVNIGKNYKFPTMLQQISVPSLFDLNPGESTPTLNPEINNNVEFGLELTRELENEPRISGWQLNLNYFRNSYTNKIRMFYVPHSPIAFYDNVDDAEISGLEARGRIFLFQKKVTLEAGSSNYSISEKAAFPFKSEHKHVTNLFVDHAGYSLQIHGFYESEQVGWIRNEDGLLSEFSLEGYSNIDVHFGKYIDIKKMQLFINFSGRNLLDDDAELEGLALRDRRLYLTLGFQY